MSPVSPYKDLTTGLRYVASRVWPAGNCSSPPRESHDSYPNFFSRVTGERRKRTIGTANAAPTMPLRKIPSFTSITRLDIPLSSLTEILLCRGLSRLRVRLAWKLCPVGRKPGHDIGNFLCRHRSAFNITAPVRCTQFRPSCNHYRSKILVTNQSKVGFIHNRAGLAPSMTVQSVTG